MKYLLLITLLTISCPAQIFRGRVSNGSTGNPIPSSKVILFTPSGEQGRAMTNDSGEFQISPRANLGRQASAILQVTQDGVDYFKPVVSGQFTDFKVYQSANRVSLISDQLSILQFQSAGDRLQVTELHALSNSSNPPVTQVDPNNFAVSIPDGVQIEAATVSAPDGGTSKVPLRLVAGSADQYTIDFPIKPGVTKYAIRYEFPYTQKFVFRRQTQYPMDRIGIMIPKSMHLRPLSPQSFHPAANLQHAEEQRFELNKLSANTVIAFSLSGSGELAHSFRPLQPGEHTTSAPFPSHTSVVATAGSSVIPQTPFPHSSGSNHKRTIVIAIILSAAALACFFMVRAKVRIRAGDRPFLRM